MPSTPAPATIKRGDPPPPEFDYRQEAAGRMREAAVCLRRYLEPEPRRLDHLTAVEMDVLAAGVGKGFIRRMEQAASKLDKQERHARRATMPREPYPSVSRRAFDRTGEEPS